MEKHYKFNEDKGCYEFCDGKDCCLQDALKDGDPAHVACKDCIEDYEGVPCDQKDLHSTPKIRKLRKEEVPHATEFIIGVGTSSHRKRTLQSRPDLDAIEAGDV
jgi:hypothetical protein